MDRLSSLQVDKERASLIDHVGARERIMKTPLARVHAIKIRRFIVLSLATRRFALLHKFGNGLLVPLVTMLVAYPGLGLDQIGVELQNPFSRRSLSYVPTASTPGRPPRVRPARFQNGWRFTPKRRHDGYRRIADP
jgi:putative membrane protein